MYNLAVSVICYNNVRLTNTRRDKNHQINISIDVGSSSGQFCVQKLGGLELSFPWLMLSVTTTVVEFQKYADPLFSGSHCVVGHCMVAPTAYSSREPLELLWRGLRRSMHQSKVMVHATCYSSRVLPGSNNAGIYIREQPRNKPTLKMLIK